MKAAFANLKSSFNKAPEGIERNISQTVVKQLDGKIWLLGMLPAYGWVSCLAFPNQKLAGRSS